MPLLSDLVSSVADGRIEVIDLTAPLQSSTPILHLPEPFSNTIGFSLEEISAYNETGPGWYWNNIHTGEHVGTHVDAPNHWITGRDAGDIASAPVNRLIGPAVVLEVSDRVADNPDFLLEKSDVLAWQDANGPLPENGWLLFRTGWDIRSADSDRFLNVDETGSHTPGVSAECARWLATETGLFEAVGRELAALGVARVFGVVDSGNFVVTNALVAAGVDFVAARHEGGAAPMADAYARMTGRVAVVSVHQGCGFTNALTGICEAAKIRTPLVLAADTPGATAPGGRRPASAVVRSFAPIGPVGHDTPYLSGSRAAEIPCAGIFHRWPGPMARFGARLPYRGRYVAYNSQLTLPTACHRERFVDDRPRFTRSERGCFRSSRPCDTDGGAPLSPRRLLRGGSREDP